jgi:hypothetical protein
MGLKPVVVWRYMDALMHLHCVNPLVHSVPRTRCYVHQIYRKKVMNSMSSFRSTCFLLLFRFASIDFFLSLVCQVMPILHYCIVFFLKETGLHAFEKKTVFDF